MIEISVEQIRSFRLQSHHLDKKYKKTETIDLVGACGMQNSPPWAWETALFNRVDGYTLSEGTTHFLTNGIGLFCSRIRRCINGFEPW